MNYVEVLQEYPIVHSSQFHDPVNEMIGIQLERLTPLNELTGNGHVNAPYDFLGGRRLSISAEQSLPASVTGNQNLIGRI